MQVVKTVLGRKNVLKLENESNKKQKPRIVEAKTRATQRDMRKIARPEEKRDKRKRKTRGKERQEEKRDQRKRDERRR